jgi:hypothetical protein|tara:strand:- start:114 stop:317 length:204 start_codon:yes stop_codon:yes gene_type:complete
MTRVDLKGQVLIVFKQRSAMEPEIFRISFNTAFVPKNNEIVFTKTEVGPDKLHHDDKVLDKNFKITL